LTFIHFETDALYYFFYFTKGCIFLERGLVGLVLQGICDVELRVVCHANGNGSQLEDVGAFLLKFKEFAN
jgi:hypothetical protein